MITVQHSLQFMLESIRKEHDLTKDALKIALLNDAFAFDPSVHATWADCSASEITAGNGYTAGGEDVLNVVASIDTVNNLVTIDADPVTWTASGGDIPLVGSAVIYNSSHANSTVYKCIDFGTDYGTPDGKLFQINFSNGLGYVKEGV